MAKPEAQQGTLNPMKEPVEKLFTRDFLLLATVNLTMFFSFQMATVGMPVYVDQLGAGAEIVGLVSSLTTIAAVVVRIFAGPMVDRFGRAASFILGIAFMVCAFIAYAIFPVIGIILGIRILHGIGWGSGSTASATLAADIIPKKRFAEGMGYFAMTNAISSALAPALAITLVQGAGAIYMIAVAGAIALLALVLAIIQTLLGRRSTASALPKGDAADEPAADEPGELGEFGEPGELGELGEPVAEPRGEAAKGFDAIFERRAFVPGMLMLLVNMGFGCITTFIALHAQAQGVNSVSLYFLVYAAVTLVSRPLIGKLIDAYGYRAPSIFSGLCTAGTLTLIALSTNLTMFAIAGALAGLGIGTAMGTFQTMAVASVEPWRRGVATSTYLTIFDLGIAVGPLIGGFIAGPMGYSTMFLIIALMPLASCIISIFCVKKGAGTR